MVETPEITFSDHLQMLSWGFIWTLFVLICANKFGYFNLPKKQISSFPTAILFGAFIVFLTLQLFLAPLISFLLFYLLEGGSLNDQTVDPKIWSWFNLISVPLTAGGLLLYLHILPSSYQEQIWGLEAFRGSTKRLQDISFGMISWIVCFPILIVLSQLCEIVMIQFGIQPEFEQVAVTQLKKTFENPWLFWSTAFLIVTLVPVIEECLFRGVLQNWAKGFLGFKSGIALTAAIFAIFHFSYSQGWNNVPFILALFLLGCFLGFIYEKQKSLWASISLHATFNAISIWMITHR